jgi:hypothetical protein
MKLISKYETHILPQYKLDPCFVTGFIDGEGVWVYILILMQLKMVCFSGL